MLLGRGQHTPGLQQWPQQGSCEELVAQLGQRVLLRGEVGKDMGAERGLCPRVLPTACC